MEPSDELISFKFAGKRIAFVGNPGDGIYWYEALETQGANVGMHAQLYGMTGAEAQAMGEKIAVSVPPPDAIVIFGKCTQSRNGAPADNPAIILAVRLQEKGIKIPVLAIGESIDKKNQLAMQKHGVVYKPLSDGRSEVFTKLAHMIAGHGKVVAVNGVG